MRHGFRTPLLPHYNAMLTMATEQRGIQSKHKFDGLYAGRLPIV